MSGGSFQTSEQRLKNARIHAIEAVEFLFGRDLEVMKRSELHTCSGSAAGIDGAERANTLWVERSPDICSLSVNGRGSST